MVKTLDEWLAFARFGTESCTTALSFIVEVPGDHADKPKDTLLTFEDPFDANVVVSAFSDCAREEDQQSIRALYDEELDLCLCYILQCLCLYAMYSYQS